MHESPGRPVNMWVLLGQAWGRAGDPAWLVLVRGPPLAPCRMPGTRTEAERGATTETPPRALGLGPLGGGREGPAPGQLPGVAGRTGRRCRCWSRRKTSEEGAGRRTGARARRARHAALLRAPQPPCLQLPLLRLPPRPPDFLQDRPLPTLQTQPRKRSHTLQQAGTLKAPRSVQQVTPSQKDRCWRTPPRPSRSRWAGAGGWGREEWKAGVSWGPSFCLGRWGRSGGQRG